MLCSNSELVLKPFQKGVVISFHFHSTIFIQVIKIVK